MKYINYLKLNEDITSGSAIVYHRTKRKETMDLIKQSGHISANSARWGRGFYACYDKNNLTKYGDFLVECKIVSLKGFLIFNYDIAKKVYGKNYLLKDQIKILLGNKWNFYKDDFFIKDIDLFLSDKNSSLKREIFLKNYLKGYNLNIKKIVSILDKINTNDGINYSDKLKKEIGNEDIYNLVNSIPSFSTNETSTTLDFLNKHYRPIIGESNGVIFKGWSDGNVLVAYNDNNVKPLRYSTDNGKTWTNIISKNIYLKNKKYKEREEVTLDYLIEETKSLTKDNNIIKYINDNYDFIIKNYNNIKNYYNGKIYMNNLYYPEDYYKNNIIHILCALHDKQKFVDFLSKNDKDVFGHFDEDCDHFEFKILFNIDGSKKYPTLNYSCSDFFYKHMVLFGFFD